MKIEMWVLVKGMMMGAADIVPGVSGGTIAFITGIYERLLNALKSFLPQLIRLFEHKQFGLFVRESDLGFLLTLFAGILISVISLAKGITFLMVHYPVPLWSGFFGLILASVYVVAQDVSEWTPKRIFTLLLGVLLALGITQLTPTALEKTALTIFLSGAVAICAMVLPGISGSFILVILGSYAWILSAVKHFEWFTLGLFSLGCFVGLLSIANVLSWAFERFREATLALLTGFMIGALNKVWPWREVVSYRENSQGEAVPLVEELVLPHVYQLATGKDAQLGLAILCFVLSAALVYCLSYCLKSVKK